MDPSDLTPLEIDYLAKDYASFRQLMLDHLKLRVPGWNEPSAADLGNVIVEVLAYAADYLSYYQDAVATEAYLGTARRRRSIKRHARLLDYHMHEGCNARTWVQVQVDQATQLPRRTQLLTHAPRLDAQALIPSGSPLYYEALNQGAAVFETTHPAWLYPELNQAAFDWEDGRELILPQGALKAVLAGELPHLQTGSVLIFQEMLNTLTGLPLGANPAHRHAVRLTGLARRAQNGHPVVEIEWADEDALPFPLSVAGFIDGEFTGDISLALGNIVLADHGMTIPHEALPPVLAGVRYRPGLGNTGLTFSDSVHTDPASLSSARAGLVQDVRSALPSVSLFQLDRTIQVEEEENLLSSLTQPPAQRTARQILTAKGLQLAENFDVLPVGQDKVEIRDRQRGLYLVASQSGRHSAVRTFKKWTVRPDLLNSGPLSTDYIVDVEEDGRAYLRFGFGGHGRLPSAGDVFQVSYRVGTGTAGNIRADTIAHIASSDTRITAVNNPLSAQGGIDREPVEDVRLYAPFAFQSQERCVTPADYEAILRRYPGVLNAAAQVRWTGSFYTAFVSVQRLEGLPLDASFKGRLGRYMEPFLLSGAELELRPPSFVPLGISLEVDLKKGFDPNRLEMTLRQVFSNQRQPGGQDGFFYPDAFTFQQTLYLSQVIAAVMALPGVARVQATRFCRLDRPAPAEIPEHIRMGPTEIARLDNDPARPENGVIQFVLKGGL